MASKTKEDCNCADVADAADGCVKVQVHVDLKKKTLDVNMESGCTQPVGAGQAPAPTATQPLAAWNRQSGGDTFQVIFNGKVYENAWWVEAIHCPGQVDDPNTNPWRYKRDATQPEMDELGNPTDCNNPIPEPGDALTRDDAQTLAGYKKVGYERDGSGTSKLSYSSARVAKPVYNQYAQASTKPKVSAYITDWCQYDGRLDKPADQLEAKDYGRGFDLLNIPVTAYDRLIFSFMGVYKQARNPETKPGDKDIADSIIAHAEGAGFGQLGHVTLVDAWGDLASYRNCGLTAGHYDVTPTNWLNYYTESQVAGLLGGLRELKKKADAANHPLDLAFSIGGWSMSAYFSPMAADPAQRKVFIDSVIDIFTRFPMFSAVDIDWEYPGGGGLDFNPVLPEDGANFALLIEELRARLDALPALPGGKKREITIAAACDVEKLKRANIPELIRKGLNNVYLMAYDFFGFSWANELAHHTNLHASPGRPFSAEAAVKYLLESGVPSTALHMGYANYGRAAAQANPDTGTHNKQGSPLGSFEAGAVEFFDSIFNHIDFTKSPPEGKHGFTLYTDPTPNADYLYSSTMQHFISLDTPRTVKAKAEFALEHQLGGMFSWSADQDDGLLCNAAREGLGYSLTANGKTFDMAPTYKPGATRPLGPTGKGKGVK
ncbi:MULTISPECIES: glycosyl hydrolase family 18 protein [unclassified Corallococcus]|uniref:glycosyl hydrolase family 18 protein n=1 Tax=unclassified Corallococcus TaxID=2685029 RepID=UPI001A8E05B1|nr:MULTISPECIES: glycosyl hydrolase family 18 protein [unclassified Corallococcus]MBN9682593.1 hypothetical protein [Corallococcus sp. NCSPR001]WAS85861.1 glycosyl hydrolase family 18 protein [Corallococcus sp. NCRR]